MRIIFMGTPDFAAGVLEELITAGHEVVLAVTQPDKPKGRGKEMQFPAVKTVALEHGIEVFQPDKVRVKEAVEFLKSKEPEIIVVAAFGQILPKEILQMAEYGCINVHASLLPKYRGAAPIQWSIINGDKVTGVTTMRMDIGIDTGDMIDKTEVVLAPDETAGTLFDKLSVAGAKLCVETISKIEAGTAVYTKQKEEESTHTSMIRKQMGRINWERPAVQIERLIRGLNPWPSAYTSLDGKTLKIWKAVPLQGGNPKKAGKIVELTKDGIQVQTGEGILELKEVQLEGKKRMPADAFLRGVHLESGMTLGE